MTETGAPPTGTRRRFIRRRGYFLYRIHVIGRMRALEVETDARTQKITAIRENPVPPHGSAFTVYKALPGRCPLQDVSTNTGE